jgi:hypothetical protein
MWIRHFERLRATEVLNVLRCLLLDHIGDIVNRDDAEQSSPYIDDGQGEQVPFGKQPRGDLLVLLRPDRGEGAPHNLADACAGWRQHKLT